LERISCRLLPFEVADGPANMAADEAILHSALEGAASLRFYAWSPPTLSLGYFQSEAVRRSDPLLAALPFVRRPSGGDTLVHDRELTYALALPAGLPWQSRTAPWLGRMHEIIAAALSDFGINAESFSARLRGDASALCFHHFTTSDLILNDAKIAGSAQRKHRGALLQHGAILLRRSASAPSLPGIRELTSREIRPQELIGAICREFAGHIGWVLDRGAWTNAESENTKVLADTKYRSDAWNFKR
jgi:lipoate-protein ligase A